MTSSYTREIIVQKDRLFRSLTAPRPARESNGGAGAAQSAHGRCRVRTRYRRNMSRHSEDVSDGCVNRGFDSDDGFQTIDLRGSRRGASGARDRQARRILFLKNIEMRENPRL
ncbi:hypothetical protein EVAR_75792_1 [Eumeta japonica]|uniref:Uncharacterized protein n=1 Tax=Eumeta variegata TaxID=151549 RepID=A0A4C1TFK7_EUMVA|nr:hypothetical protein EVAR_75792_1 [Eumeta japonica]